jgi:hypothetical protein
VSPAEELTVLSSAEDVDSGDGGGDEGDEGVEEPRARQIPSQPNPHKSSQIAWSENNNSLNFGHIKVLSS